MDSLPRALKALVVRPPTVALVLLLACRGGAPSGAAPGTDPPSTAPPGAPLPPGSVRGEVLTSKNDNLRTGANLEEDVLTKANVAKLTLRATLAVDGELYAQPLVVAGVDTPAGRHDLVIAATMNNSVFAFDLDAPDGAPPLWQTGRGRELGKPGTSSRNVFGPHGILSTPVIDKARGAVFVVSRDCHDDEPVTVGSCANKTTVGRCTARLSALDLGTGAVRASTTIAYDGGPGGTPFDATVQWNRPGLLLEGGRVLIAFGSGPNGNQHEEDFVYHGYLFRYDAEHLDTPPEVFMTTRSGRGGSVWQGGAAPASDGAHVYLTSANRILDCAVHKPSEFPSKPDEAEDSVVRLPLGFASARDAVTFADTRPYTADGFSGTVFQFTNAGDVGFGSSGPTLLPGSNDLVVGSKGGIVYVLDRDTMLPTAAPVSPFTALPLQGDHSLHVHSWWGIPVLYGALAFYRPAPSPGELAPYGFVYGWAQDDYLRALRYDYGTRALSSAATADVPAMPGGAYISVSARDGHPESAIVWATSRTVTGSAQQGHVWAFDALTLQRLWDVDTPAFSKFTPPTVARGRLLVPSAAANGPKAILVYAL